MELHLKKKKKKKLHFVEAFRALVTPAELNFSHQHLRSSPPPLSLPPTKLLDLSKDQIESRPNHYPSSIPLHPIDLIQFCIARNNAIVRSFSIFSPPFSKIETKGGTIYIYIYISFERSIVSHRYRGSRFPPSNLAGSLGLISSRFNILAIMRHLA